VVSDSPDFFLSVAQQALWVTALVSAWVLVPVLLVGLLVGIVQAATSINEATLSFVPKLIVVGIVLALFGSAMMTQMTDFARDIYGLIPKVTR
jgi:flagellar biosynthesis protein FliQ